MSTHEHFRKISLSKSELAEVYRDFSTAMQARITKNLTASTPDDEMLAWIQKHAHKKIERTFEMAKHALVLDGMDLAVHDVPVKEVLSIKPKEVVEPFDTALNKKLRDLIQDVEKQTTEVTRLRRDLPQQARSIYEQLVTMTDEEVTKVVKEIETVSDSKTTEEQNGINNNEDGNEAKGAGSSPRKAASSNASRDSNGNSTAILEDIDAYFPAEVTKVLEMEPSLPENDAIREKFSAAIGELHALKRDVSETHARVRNVREASDMLLQIHKRRKVEPQIYS